MPFDESRFIIRDFTDADDAECKDLETRASMAPGRVTRALLSVHFTHNRAFNAKASQFDDHSIIVAQCRDTKTIAGCVCLGVKHITYKNTQHTIGYLFDLRVREDYQRCGIGKRLSGEVEARLWARGADFVYLSVNSDNARAQKLYEVLGYSVCSRRTPFSDVLIPSWRELLNPFASDVPDIKHTVTVSTQPSQKILAEYKKRDMWLANEGAIVGSEFFRGFAHAEDGDSYASVGMWDSSALSGFVFNKFLLLPGWVWGTTWFQLLLLSAPVALMVNLARSMTVLSLTSAVVVLAMTVAAVQLRGFVADGFSQRKIRFRIFAPIVKGPKGGELFQSVLQKARVTARQGKYLMTVCNLDEKDASCEQFQKRPLFRTIFMAKPRPGAATIGMFAPDAFFDPRDI